MGALDGLPVRPLRLMIRDHIQANPGVCVQELADQMEVARTAVVHHVRRLVKEGHIQKVRKGRRVLHFPLDVRQPAHRSLLATIRLGNARAILTLLREDPTLSWRHLARSLDITPKAVRWHMSEMERDGLVRVVRFGGGQQHRVHLHPDLEAWMDGDRNPQPGKASKWSPDAPSKGQNPHPPVRLAGSR